MKFKDKPSKKELNDYNKFLNHTLLYDSCKTYVDHYLYENHKIGVLLPSCFGDENILELCNRCPYFKILENDSQK